MSVGTRHLRFFLLMVIVAFATMVVVVSSPGASVEATDRPPILIEDDSDFTAANGVVSGSGSTSDPYVISGWSINHSTDPAIRINDTTKHFVLKQMNLTCTDSDSWSYTIWFERTENSTLIDLTINNPTLRDILIRGNSAGTHLIKNVTTSPPGRCVVTKCDTVTVVDSTWYQIEISEMDDATVLRNTIAGGGLSITSSGNANVYRCSSSVSSGRISISSVHRGNITDCTFMNDWGSSISLSNRVGTPGDFKLRNNRMGPVGLKASGYYDIDTSNTVDGRPVYYLINKTGMRLDSDVGQLYLKGCRNMVVANLSLTTTFYGIYGEDIRGCTFENLTLRGRWGPGLYLSGLKGCRVLNNTIHAAAISYAENLTFADNLVTGDTGGGQDYCVAFGNGDIGPTKIWFINNTLSDSNRHGYRIGMAWDASTQVFLIGGSVHNVTETGVEIENARGLTLRNMTIWDCYTAMDISVATDSKVSGNIVRDCQQGIWGRSGWYLVIDSNTVVNCTGYGIRPNSKCRVSNNTMVNCTVGLDLTQNILSLTVCENNTIIGGVHGIEIISVKVLVTRTSISNCSDAGIYLFSTYSTTGRRIEDCQISGCPIGIHAMGGQPIEISRCTVSNCTTGIYIRGTWNNLIQDCTISDCSGYGIEIGPSSLYNKVYHNNLIRTDYDASFGTYNGPQVSAYSINNDFNVSMEGNYWDDYLTRYPSARTTDGRIWDTPYAIDGPGSCVDAYPLVIMADGFPPVVMAGPDRTVDQNTTVTLDGSGSRDNYGITAMSWAFVYGGTPVSLDGAVVHYTFDLPGKYTITLEASDAWGNVGRDALVLTVLDTQAPVAEAGPDIRVDMNEDFTLDAGGSHDNGDIVEYTWTIDPDGLNITVDGLHVDMSLMNPGRYTVELLVKDAAGHQATDSLRLVIWDLIPPEAAAGDDVEVDQGDTVTLDGTGSSDNVAIAHWNWTLEYGGEPLTLTGPEPVHRFDTPGVYSITLEVADTFGLTGTDTVVVTVHDTEAPDADAGSDIGVDQGDTVTLDGTGSTDNGAIAFYKWTFMYNGSVRTLYDGEAEFTFWMPGEYIVTLRVVDLEDNLAEDTLTVTVRDTVRPTAVVDLPGSVDQGSTIVLDGGGSHDNVGVVRGKWTFSYGGVDVSLEGISPSYTFPIPGELLLTFTALDADGNSDSVEVMLTIADTVPPVAVAPTDTTVVEGTTLILDGSQSTDNHGIASYEWKVVFGGSTESGTGVTKSHHFERVGQYTVTLRITDTAGNFDIDNMLVSVRPVIGEWRIGPFTDGKGDPVGKAKVTVEFNGTTYEGRTDGAGVATLDISWHDLVAPGKVTVTKDGWKKLGFDIDLDDDRNPAGEIPVLERRADDSPAAGVVLAVLALLACLVMARGRGDRRR